MNVVDEICHVRWPCLLGCVWVVRLPGHGGRGWGEGPGSSEIEAIIPLAAVRTACPRGSNGEFETTIMIRTDRSNRCTCQPEIRTNRLKQRSSNGPVETCGVGGRMGGLAFPVVRRLREGSHFCSFLLKKRVSPLSPFVSLTQSQARVHIKGRLSKICNGIV